MELKPNEPMYPIKTDAGQHSGINVREYFAGLAMSGLLAGITQDTFFSETITAQRAILYADTLINELNKKGE